MTRTTRLEIYLAIAVLVAVAGCVLGCPKQIIKMANPIPASYEGCFEDRKRDLDLPALAGYHPDMKKSLCETWCKKKKTKYFGMQEGVKCFCGDEFGKHGQAEEVMCGIRCVGAREERCGGVLHNSIYKIAY